MRSVFGWDLPPGCSISDIPGNRPEDFLAEAIAEGYRPHCKKCGGFLPIEPNSISTDEDVCDGVGKEYEMDYDESSIRILGEEYRNKTYKVNIAVCGEEGDHNPHVMYVSEQEIRKCKKCGHINKEVIC